MEYETVAAALGYFAMLTSAVNLIIGIFARERNNAASARDGERQGRRDSGGGGDYF